MKDKMHTDVGVFSPVPQYPNENDVYMSTSACPFRSNKMHLEDRDMRMMEVFGRLRPGVTVAQANADVSTIAAGLKAAYPKSYPENAGYTSAATPLQEELTKEARPTLLLLLGAAAFVLLIACANVANLTLARMAKRERELAVRSALGAGRSRLLRQLLTESFLMAFAAACWVCCWLTAAWICSQTLWAGSRPAPARFILTQESCSLRLLPRLAQVSFLARC